MTKKLPKLEDLSDSSLLYKFEETVKFWHYEGYPQPKQPEYNLEDLRQEVITRMTY